MKIKSLASLITATLWLSLHGHSKEPEQATKAPATTSAESQLPSESLKETEAKLLGKWTIAAEATKAMPVDLVKYPWMPAKLESLIAKGLSWEFRKDGTVVETSGALSRNHGYHLLQDGTGVIWIAMTRTDDWKLIRTRFDRDQLHFTSIARGENGEERRVTGTLVLSKSQ